MFCFQCQESSRNIGCTTVGICGKTAETSNLLDLLLFVTRGIAIYNQRLRRLLQPSAPAERFILDALFSSITNANFDANSIENKIAKGYSIRKELCNKLYLLNDITFLDSNLPIECTMIISTKHIHNEWRDVGVLRNTDNDIRSLIELATCGIKGMAAYIEHASNLDRSDTELLSFIEYALSETTREHISKEDALNLVLEVGTYGTKAMKLLHDAHADKYGSCRESIVPLSTGSKPGILVSGHDLRDLEDLLIETKEHGIDIYTHCEMLPAFYRPYFKQFNHLRAHYGESWWKQRDEFTTFNGPILFTSNCIVPPLPGAQYKGRLYTTGSTGLPGAIHITDRQPNGRKDFSIIIEHAKSCAAPTPVLSGEIKGGYSLDQIIDYKDKLISNIKSGAIRKFIVMAGCDGRTKSRSYYTQFANALPKDTIILTAGCAKFRYIKLPLGDINGIPRILDCGQCNDSYSIIQIAQELQEIYQTGSINTLPISFNLAWYEQKAIIVLLSLLSLGIRNIHIGPSLPAFLTPAIAKILTKEFGLAGISDVYSDVKHLG
ncbi:MAG TPA: hydroxylamine reductase [Porphyromonadaceae bacterium]|nr:hydroxylamine reductase [Porphyromonadaceae bacterium]